MKTFRVSGAAVTVLILLAGCTPAGSSSSEPAAQPSTSAAPSVEASESGFVPEGEFLWLEPGVPPFTSALDDGPPITVTIPASGWTYHSDSGGLMKGDGTDPPEAAMLSWSTTGGFSVYGDPCHWTESKPDTPATTVDEMVAALAAQPTRDASEPVDVTIGGHAGKQITLYVPNEAQDRAEAFADCDQNEFATFAFGDGSEPSRWHQGPGQVDDFWILDVDGALVVIDAMYRIDSGDLPDTPDELIEEMRSIAESATFE